MPASLSVSPNINLKSIKLITLLLLSPLIFFAQSLTGLWTGVLTNDSNSIRKDQSFEIALTEYRGKVYGYSRSEFIVNDTLYYIVKRVKGTIEGDMCEVKDDNIISYNFPTRLDKGVKVVSTFYRSEKDSAWYLAGSWKTNKTKNYYSITGKVDLKEEKDLTASKIFPHLQELNLADDVSFYKDRKKETAPVVKTVSPDNKKPEPAIKTDQPTSKEPDIALNKPAVKTEDIKSTEQKKAETILTSNKTDAAITKTELKPEPEKQKPIKTEQSFNKETVAASDNLIIKKEEIKADEPKKTEAITVSNKNDATLTKTELKPEKQKDILKTEPQTINKDAVTNLNKPDAKTVAITKSSGPSIQVTETSIVNKKTETIAAPSKNQNASNKPTIEKKEPVIGTTLPENKKELPNKNDAAALITERKSEFSQIVNFKSDSLELALYDNGEIDGDTVSVLLNGEVILAKQGLKASAIKKTIYITPGKDNEFNLVLYAENLGKYPPNTGLLVVHDGDDVYNVRFSADFQTNAGIIFRKKQKQ